MAEFLRDAPMTAAIFGFFAASWFGWAQERPPVAWRKYLILGSILSGLAIVGGGLLGWQHWDDPTALDADTSRSFGILVGIEFGLAGIGAAILGIRRRAELIPVWIGLVVGLHLFPVAVLFSYPFLHVVAALVTLAALAAVPVARKRSVTVSAVNGVGVGTALLIGAYVSLIDALTRL
jgi:hypothetical protein